MKGYLFALLVLMCSIADMSGQARFSLDNKGKLQSAQPTERPESSTLYTQADTVRYRKLVVAAYQALQKDSFAEAKLAFEQALKAVPRMDSNVEVCYELGQLEERDGHTRSAIDYYTRAIKRNSHYVKAYLRRGGMYLMEGEEMMAVKDFNEVISIDYLNKDAYFFRGCAYANNGQYELAEKDFSTLLKRDASDERATYSMALVELHQNKLEDAFIRMNGLILRYPKESLYYATRAEINEKRQLVNDAEKDWQMAVDLMPGELGIVERFARFLMRQHRKSDAMKIIDKAGKTGVSYVELMDLRQRVKKNK